MTAPDKQPLDYDPTGYYARKEKHRAEMLPFVGWCVVGMVLIVAGAALWQAFQ